MYELYCAVSSDAPSSIALLNRQRKLDYCAAISKKINDAFINGVK